MQQDSSFSFGRNLHHPDHRRSGQAGIGHKNQVDRAKMSPTVGELSRYRRFPRPHSIGSPDRHKSFDPDLITGCSPRN
jgi:hypothetical protein